MDADSPRRFQRAQFAVVLVLSSLNGTFERKCLVVPFAPDVLKLGRQTTFRTQAAPDNGYFDSRVLSRQHAEIWADYDSGKVWLRDAKSSNGTYINKKRLSAENTESAPHELCSGDLLDLGIDIVCNDETKQMYKKISAKVEKISMLPLHVGSSPNATAALTTTPSASASASASAPAPASKTASATAATGSGESKRPSLPQLNRSPSLETLKGAAGSAQFAKTLSGGEAIFGALNPAEQMALSHAHTTAGGQLVGESIKQNINFEVAAKSLVAQIRAVRADTAKIRSVAVLLENIRSAAVDAAEHDRATALQLNAEKQEILKLKQEGRRAAKSSSLAALKAENTRLRAELSHTTQQRPETRGRGLSVVGPPRGGTGGALRDAAAAHTSGTTGSSSTSSTSSTSTPANQHSLALQTPQHALPGAAHAAAQSPSPSSASTSASASSPSSATDSGAGAASAGGALSSLSAASQVPHGSRPPDSKIVLHNLMVLAGTTLLVTLAGVWIMFFFNPPKAPQSHSHLLFLNSPVLNNKKNVRPPPLNL